jgi:hypothetical protein
MLKFRWTREATIDAFKLGCGALLVAVGLVSGGTGPVAWTTLLCGYAICAVALAALVAEAEWEPKLNFTLGTLTAAAAFVPGLRAYASSTEAHVSTGVIVSILSVIELWRVWRDPPWRFQPGSAARPVRKDRIAVDATNCGASVRMRMNRAVGRGPLRRMARVADRGRALASSNLKLHRRRLSGVSARSPCGPTLTSKLRRSGENVKREGATANGCVMARIGTPAIQSLRRAPMGPDRQNETSSPSCYVRPACGAASASTPPALLLS